MSGRPHPGTGTSSSPGGRHLCRDPGEVGGGRVTESLVSRPPDRI